MKRPSRKKAVLIQIIGGYINTALSITQGLLLLPIYFNFIDFATYGYWITITSIIAMLGIVNFGIGNMVMQRLSSSFAKRNFQAVADYFINSQFLYYIIAFSLLVIGLILSFWLQSVLSLDRAHLEVLSNAYLIALITASLTVLSDSFRGFAQALLKPLFGFYSMILARIVGIILTVVLLYQNIGVLSIPIGLLITEMLILSTNGVYAYYQYRKLNVKSRLKKNIIFEYLHFSPHLFGLIVGNTLSNKSHPLIITTFLGSEMTTAYTVTRKAVEIILQALNVFNASLIAPFSHLVGEGDEKKIKTISIKIISISFFASLVAFGTYIATNHMFVSLWISNDVVLSQEVISIMGLGAIAYTMTRLLRSQLFGLNEFKYTSAMIFTEGVGFVIASVLLVNIVGVIGVALALSAISFLVAMFLGHKLLNKLDIVFNKVVIIKQLMMVAILLAVAELFTFFHQDSWFSFIVLSLLSIIVIILIEFVMNYNYLISLKITRKKEYEK